MSIPKDDAKFARIGDMVAASACFPAGFEPLEFPDDFVWPDDAVPDRLLAEIGGKSVALMDGGIYDNQGVDALDKLVGTDYEDYGLFVISDVDQNVDEIYPYPGRLLDLGFGHHGADRDGARCAQARQLIERSQRTASGQRDIAPLDGECRRIEHGVARHKLLGDQHIGP